MKKILFAFIVLLTVNCIYAVSFAPDVSLQNIPKIEDNNIDLYKINEPLRKGLLRTYFNQEFKTSVKFELEYDENRIKLTFKYKEIDDIYPPVYIPFDKYVSNIFSREFKDKTQEIRIAKLQEEDRGSGSGLIKDIVIKLPKMAVPKPFRKIFKGNQAAKLSLDGSQKVTFGLDRTTRSNVQDYEASKNGRWQPDMLQELNLRLKGTIGSKIHVSVDHQSSSEDDLVQPTEVNISYRGDDDEIVKTIEGGNIALALSGSNYISYSMSSEGLFGIKSDMEIGNLKLTTIMGKDQAKKSTQNYVGGAAVDSVNIKSKEYVLRNQYFLDDPEVMYAMYAPEDADADSVPPGWLNNALRTNEYGGWLLTNIGAGILPQEGSVVQLYLDDNDTSNDNSTIPGIEIGDDSESYDFEILTEPDDFYINDAGIVTLHRSIALDYTIGITYTQSNGTQIGNPIPEAPGDPIEVKILRMYNQDGGEAYADYWKLQVKNVYNLGLPNIQNDGFDIKIYIENSDGTPNYNLPGAVDIGLLETFLGQEIKTFNDYLQLDTNGDDIINNDDEPIDLVHGYIMFPFLQPFASFGDSLINENDIYLFDRTTLNNTTSYPTKTFINVKGKIGRDEITLGQIGILPGSVKVKINSTTAKENIDYVVDYDIGIVSLLSAFAKNPDADIDIDYQFRPLFGIESKTLLGARADIEFNDHAKLGGTIIYQSEKVSEERPKIGSENRSIIMADLDGEVGTELPFITSALDFLPLIDTDEESSVSLSGEVAVSVPRIWGNPDQADIKEAYIDDMESILNSYPLGVTRSSWVPASRPFDTDFGKATPNWYNPQDVTGEQVYDPETLTIKEKNEKITVLECKLTTPTLENPHVTNKYWGGLMKYIGNQIDFSSKKYIEVLVKIEELTTGHIPEVVMHVDVGNSINEDFYTDFGGEGVLNREEEHKGVFRHSESLSVEDGYGDVGLDGIRTDSPGDDPNDDFEFDSGADSGSDEYYAHINGTEKNHKRDTEDLNDDGGLNEDDLYFEYSVALNDTTSDYFTSEFQGWKLYRIPLRGEENYKIVSDVPGRVPDLRKISYTRVWFDVEEAAAIRMVYLDIVGNKWVEDNIRNEQNEIISDDDLEDFAENMQVGIIDNQKNVHYEPAPNTVFESTDEGAKEQSLFIDYTNLQSGHFGLAAQTFSDVFRQATALLRYDKIRFWYYAEKFEGSVENYSEQDTLLIRIGTDSLNYYEIKHPFTTNEYSAKMQKNNWKQLEVEFADLAYIKSIGDSVYIKDNYTFSIKGRPTLTHIDMFWLGMEAKNDFSGRIYFDDIRVADPYEDTGYAARTDFHASFADFSTFDLGLEWKTPNFQTSTNRNTLPSYKEEVSLSMSNKYYLRKFFPAEWGVSFPVTLSRDESKGVPRFQANSDVPLTELDKEGQEHEKSKSLIYRATTSFGLNKKPDSKILELLVKNTSLSANAAQTYSVSPTRADSSLTYSGVHTYSLSIPEEKVSFRIWKDYRIGFFPYQMSNSFTYRVAEPNIWNWQANSDSLLPYWEKDISNSGQRSRTLDTSSGVSYKLFSDIAFGYDLDTNRDLLLGEIWGVEKDRNQTITFGYTPNYTEKIFNISINASSSYNDDHKVVSTQNDNMIYDGSVSRNIDTHITLKNKDLLVSLADWLDRDKTPEQEQEENKNTDNNKKDDEGKENKENPDPPKSPDKNSDSDEEKLRKEAEEKEAKEMLAKKEAEERRIKAKEEREKRGKEEREEKEKDEEREQNKENDKEKGKYPEKDKGKDVPEGKEEGKEGDSDQEESTPFTFSKVVRYLSRIDNISFDYDNDLGSVYKTHDYRPKMLYQLGVPNIISDSNLESRTTTEKYSGSFNFEIVEKLSTSWSASKEFSKRFGNVNTETVNTVFPSFSFTLRQFETMIGIENILTSSQLSGNYSISTSITGKAGAADPDSDQTGYSLTPLLSWTGNWVHNISTSLSANYTTSQTIVTNTSNSTTRNNSTKSLNSNISWSFKAPTGLKLPWLGRLRFKNELTTSLGFNIERTYNSEDSRDAEPTADKWIYSISPSASYKFSKNINGGLTGGYNVTDDGVSGIDLKIFNISIWVEIDF